MTGPSFFPPVINPSNPSSFTSHGSSRPPQSGPATSPSSPMEAPLAASREPSTPLAISSVYLTHPTPLSSPPAGSPPEYVITSSPPKYALLAGSSETALLLAPPPAFDTAGHCPHCLESSTRCRQCRRRRNAEGAPDWVVRVLIILNILVWAAVIGGYIAEWKDPDWTFGCCGSYPPSYRGICVGCPDDPMVPTTMGDRDRGFNWFFVKC